MQLYQITSKTLLPIKEVKVELEKTIQDILENNLLTVFGLLFIHTEFALNNLRIDTLAFDEETKSFVIIEYKKDRNISVIDQGYAYLALLLNNKADFVLAYNEKFHKSLRKADIDWSQSRIIFISSVFTKFQQEAVGFRDLPIELWEVKSYENSILSFTEIHASEKNESIKVITKGQNLEVVTKELKEYTVDDHIKPQWDKTKHLYEIFSQRMLELDPNFIIHPVKYYIGFNLEGKNVIAIKPGSTKILLELLRVQPDDLKDPEKRVRYRKNSFTYYRKHISQFDITNEEDIDYAMLLIKQVYKKYMQV